MLTLERRGGRPPDPAADAGDDRAGARADLPSTVLPRGVFEAPCVANGRRVLWAVAASGERVAEALVPREHERAVMARLRALLDLVDPPAPRGPSLTLVRGRRPC